MKRSTYLVFGGVVVLFALSWIFKSSVLEDGVYSNVWEAFKVTLAAFLTLAIFSFLYKDNPLYKFAEHLYVGISAAYWMCLAFWSTVVGNFIPRTFESLSAAFKQPYQPSSWDILGIPGNIIYIIPVLLGIMLLMRLSSKYGWLSRWPLAFIVGTTAGLNFVRYLRSDFVAQVSSTFVPLLGTPDSVSVWSSFDLNATGPVVALLSNWVIFIGVFSGLVYFFFSKEHTGWFGRTSKVGIWVLMITFGASFGYTVMGRISLLVGRITYLFGDWLGIVQS